MEKHLFFSIIIPAHNEENYILQTLKTLEGLEYPKDRFEVIVVENGSIDQTFALVSEFKQNTTLPLKTIKLDRNGVSYAKNVGASLASDESEWLIFLDADTHLKKDFLKELEETITKNDNIVIIVTSLRPLNNSFKAKAWFSFYNFGRWVSESSMSIQIVRKDIFERIKFDETLTFNEDLTLIKQSKKFGKFYYMWTNNVFTSTRRFDKVGYLKQFLIWVWWNIIPSSKRRKISYPVVR
jgi:glycosyltransferase involved in cell wall biosynthesis